MKTVSLTLMMFVLTSFNTSKEKEQIIFKDEFGKLAIKKDFIVVNYSTDKYLQGEGKYVQILVFLDKKNYLGSVSEKEFNQIESMGKGRREKQ